MPVNAPNDNLDVLAPSFNLKNIDDEMLSLDNAKGLNGTVIVFICNHCPYVKAIASRLKKNADELLEHSINTIAIMSNDVINYPCLLYTSPSPRDGQISRMPSSA